MQRYDLGRGVTCVIDRDDMDNVIWWLTAFFYWPSGYAEYVVSDEYLADSAAAALASARSYRDSWLDEMIGIGYLLAPYS